LGALLTALVALGQISTSIYIPSMPSIVDDLATTPDRVNLTLSGFLLGFAVCQMVFGPLSDRFGRRPTLIAGLGLYLAFTLVCAFAWSIQGLIVGRILQGMAACVGPVLGRAIVRDLYGVEGTAKAMAKISAALAISPAIAPIIGGYLQAWFGWRAAFIFLGGVGVVVLVATLWLLRESNPRGSGARVENHHGLLAAVTTLLADRSYLGNTMAVSCVFAGLMAFAAGGPFVFIDILRLSPQHYGMLAVFTVAGYLAGTLVAGRLAGRLPLDRLTLLGLVICITGGGFMLVAAAAAPPSTVALVAPMAVFTAGLGIVLPSGIAAAMVPFPAIAGSASALLGFLQMMVAAAASSLVGILPHDSAVPMAAVIAGGAALALLAFIFLIRYRSIA
jgi:DHA1 family bicyclomycin/chloramphenicol resistance-like MFS transporter